MTAWTIPDPVAWRHADDPPPADQPDTGDGPHSVEYAVEIDPVDSPEPDALFVVVTGRYWPPTEDWPHGAWRNREGQPLPARRWCPLSGEGR